MTSHADEQRWWEPFYDEYLEKVLLESTSVEEIDETLDFIEAKLELAPGAAVFDQCCGTGRLSIPLARRGFEVFGVDQARRYIESAREKADSEELAAEFVTADAFEYRPEEPVEGAINWWTSFGYAAEHEQNAEMVRRAYEALRPGGVFALDFLNLPGVIRSFSRDVVTRCPFGEGELLLHRESRLNLTEGVLEKTWRYVLPDGRRVSHETRVGMYMPHQLLELLRAVGFVELALFGGVDRSDLTMDSPRCIAVGRRPE